jgi:hypothetical protein
MDTPRRWVQKGMRRVLEERGVNTYKMKANAMRVELKNFEDFKCDGVPIVEEMITGRGTPWCHAKRFTRAYSNGSDYCQTADDSSKGACYCEQFADIILLPHLQRLRESLQGRSHKQLCMWTK